MNFLLLMLIGILYLLHSLSFAIRKLAHQYHCFIQAEYIKEFGLANEEIGRLLAFKPQLMGCDIEEKWKPLVKYLYYLGVRRDGMKRILTIKPSIFCVDLETIIAPKVQSLHFFL